jgi:hypothetical protein
VADIEKLKAASNRHAAQRDGILEQLLKLLFGLWGSYNRWDDVDAVAGMVARTATLVDAATTKTQLVTRAYATSVLQQLDALPTSLPPIPEGYPRANVTPLEVYSRPVEQYIWRRRNGGTMEDARKAFENRLTEIASADIAAADRDEAQNIYAASPRVTGYRRVIHPELSKSGTCGLCIVASSQVYSTDDLLPLHGGSCNCDTLPITDGDDPGLRLNEDDLKTIYAAAGSTAAEDLLNTRITINEHGELGPVLVKHGDNYKTAEDAGRPAFVRLTPEAIRAARAAEHDILLEQIGHAQQRYDAMDQTFTNSAADGPRIALFRSIKYMRERATALESLLRKTAA